MTPARRRKYLRLKKRGRRSFLKPLIYIGLALILIAFFFFNTKLWKLNQKLGLVINSPDGNVVVMSIDKQNEDITIIEIPATTQLDVARQLGSWRAKSIWTLGENEKLGGALLRETIVKNFHFPVLGWADA